MYVSVQIELLDTVALNLHRIDKDVQRCDRNYHYFTTSNLEKLRNIMCRSGCPSIPRAPWLGSFLFCLENSTKL